MNVKQARKQIKAQEKIIRKAIADFNAILEPSRKTLREIQRTAEREENRLDRLGTKAKLTKDFHRLMRESDQFGDVSQDAYDAMPVRISIRDVMG